ncbi:MAG: hypothetical protein O2955_15235 [Planctomycetota bacterium]|nr:hypothetical protein [Planctomycetota bacterium]MDA1213867.1 hypothetical protein [Planctomycetota bacterium]
MNSSTIITRLTWGLLLLAVVALWNVLDVSHRVLDQFPTVGSSREKVPPSETVVPANTTHEDHAETEIQVIPIDDDAVEAKRPIDRELSATSWRDPFELKWWRAPGWIAVPNGMQGTGTARFRKPFVRVSLSLVVEAVDEEQVPQPSLRLENVDDDDLAVVVYWGLRDITIWRERTGSSPRKIREIAIPESIVDGDRQRRNLQLIATGNRLIVAENGRKLVFCDQPSEISSQTFRIAFNAGEQEVRLRELRLDGE